MDCVYNSFLTFESTSLAAIVAMSVKVRWYIDFAYQTKAQRATCAVRHPVSVQILPPQALSKAWGVNISCGTLQCCCKTETK